MYELDLSNVILRSAFYAGRRTYAFCWQHRRCAHSA